jgi:hypothetical protein
MHQQTTVVNTENVAPGLASLKRFSMISALLTAGAVSMAVVWMSLHGRTPDGGLLELYHFLLVLMIASWLVTDAREAGRARPSFDYGWFVVAAFPIYVPYYVISTRRWRRGCLIVFAMVLLLTLPYVVQVSLATT